MYRKITPTQVTEAGAVFGSVAVFQICYIGCKLVWGRQEIATGYGVGFAICILVLLAGLVFAVIFASIEGKSPTNGATNLIFSAWKASTLLAIHFLEFLEIVIAFFRSYPEDARKERHTVLGIIVFLHAGVLFAALWLLFYSGLELLGITPALTQICIALLALRFTSMLGQPTPFTLRRLSSLAAAATLASVASTFLVLSSLIGWNRRDLACHSSICMGMLILRPATTAWAWVSKQALLERRKERHITLGGDTSQQSLHRIESREQVA